MDNIVKMKLSKIVFDESIYPRLKPNPKVIQDYANNIAVLPPIEINQHNILIDGYHRWKAHQTAGIDKIKVIVTETKSEEQLLRLAVERNASYGQQLTQEEKKKYALQWWDRMAVADICKTLCITRRTYNLCTGAKQDEKDKEIRRTIFDMHLACYTQQAIADNVGMARAVVNYKIADLHGIIGSDNSHDFDKHDRRIYTVWNFAKATNEVRHFGNIPPEIIDNLLYLYTKPFDVVFDPFGGGGSTIDVCQKRKRRYYVSDLNPIPARDTEIRKHDITMGLPKDLPVPDLVFLDPPYWKRARHKYSKDHTDLGNVGLDHFLAVIRDITRGVKRKWVNAKRETGYLALIIGPWKEDGKKIDLPFLCYEQISHLLPLHERVIVPYSTQVHGGAFVKMAKEKRELLYLHRDLMIFKWEA